MELRLFGLALCMLLTGSINTIATKYQDETVVAYSKAGLALTFRHPAVQSAFMFAGELLCLIPYFLLKQRSNPNSADEPLLADALEPIHGWHTFFTFALPACCDAVATSLLNIGLFYTFASTFQMLRGTLVLFAGLLTIVLLKRRLHIHHWLGMALIVAGAAIVGASSVIFDSNKRPRMEQPFHDTRRLNFLEAAGWGEHKRRPGSGELPVARDPALGDVLVVLAQLFAAMQFIVEEKYLAKYQVPALLAVGLEGFWGLIISVVGLPILSYVRGGDGLPLDSAVEALQQIAGSWQLQLSTLLSVFSIAWFNFFGVTITKELSGAARAAIDAVRTLFVWAFSVAVHWERFHALQVLGFIVLVSGTSLYNELMKPCLPGAAERRRRARVDLQEPLLADGALTWRDPAPGGGSSGAVPVPGWGRPPLPPSAGPRTIAGRGGAHATMARSLRLFPSALSPHSMASGVGYGSGFDSAPSVGDLSALGIPPSEDLSANNSVHSGASRLLAATQRQREPADGAGPEAAGEGA